MTGGGGGEREKTLVTKIKNERRDTTIDLRNKKYYKGISCQQIENPEVIDKFLQRRKLLKLSQEEIDLNRSIKK